MEIGLLMDMNSLEVMEMLSPVVATTLPTLAAWWYVGGYTCYYNEVLLISLLLLLV